MSTIESLGPLGQDSNELPQRLARHVRELGKPALRRTYASVETAAQRIRENNSSLSDEAAMHFARHGTREVEGGVEFTFDPALRRTSAFTFNESQILAVLEAIAAPVLVVHGSKGFSFDDEQMKTRLSKMRTSGPFSVEGGHHVHLDRPSEVAAHLVKFISALPQPPKRGGDDS